ncbi:MAG: C40 family peptidase [Nocardioidaceae bacterium]
MTEASVGVDVATMWTSPDAPRDLDTPALADVPDMDAWTSALDVQSRLDLHGRTLTQLLRGEPVTVMESGLAGWVKVAASWQPSPEHPDGYPGWVRQAHVAEAEPPTSSPVATIEPDRPAVMSKAREFIGVRYLWGGTSPWGLDCSGLVHYAYRQGGVIVPRDAYAQHAVADAVQLGEEQPGDLYFFARADGRVFHVGFVTGRLTMLHAPEGGGLIEDAPLAPERQGTLLTAGRFLSSG